MDETESMNIFEYFDKTGKSTFVDERRRSVWFAQADGSVVERDWDGTYWRTINPSFYDRSMYKSEIGLEVATKVFHRYSNAQDLLSMLHNSKPYKYLGMMVPGNGDPRIKISHRYKVWQP